MQHSFQPEKGGKLERKARPSGSYAGKGGATGRKRETGRREKVILGEGRIVLSGKQA